jgi:DNA repair exonuclease SbcCD ATPase subunit
MNPLRPVSLYLMVAEASGENPLQKFLMMGMMGGRSMSNSKVKGEVAHQGGDATSADPKQDEPTCVDPSSVAALQSQLEVAIKYQGEAETESRSLASKLTDLQAKIDRLSLDSQKKEEELQRALNAAARIRDKAISERDEMAEDVKRLLDRKAGATVASEAPSDDGAQKVGQLEADLAEQIEKTRALEKEHAALISELENEKVKEKEDLRESKERERNLAAQLDEQKKYVAALEEKHTAFKVQCEAIEKAAAAAIEDQVQTRIESEIRRAELEAEQKCQVEYSKLANSSKLALEEAEARARSLVVEQKAQKDLQLKELSEKKTQELQALAAKHMKEIDSLRRELEALDSERKRLETEKLTLVESLTRLEAKLQARMEVRSRDRLILSPSTDESKLTVLPLSGDFVLERCVHWSIYLQLDSCRGHCS